MFAWFEFGVAGKAGKVGIVLEIMSINEIRSSRGQAVLNSNATSNGDLPVSWICGFREEGCFVRVGAGISFGLAGLKSSEYEVRL